MSELHLSARGLKLIAQFEGLSLKVYNDAVRSAEFPKGHATIGYGHLLHHGAFTPDDPQSITQEEAEEMLRGDVARFVECVNKSIHIELAQNQFDALVSLAFNIGCGAFAKSSLARYVNSSAHMSGPEIRKLFCLFCKAGGKTLKGLLARRNAEATVFLASSDSDK